MMYIYIYDWFNDIYILFITHKIIYYFKKYIILKNIFI